MRVREIGCRSAALGGSGRDYTEQGGVQKRQIEIILVIIVVAVVGLFAWRKTPSSVDPSLLSVNGVSLDQKRSQIEEILGEPTFEKKTDLAAYGSDYSVSVIYDGSELNSFATAVRGDELVQEGDPVLVVGQSIEEAKVVLGNSLLVPQKGEFQVSYRIKGTPIRVLTAHESSEIRAFDSGWLRGARGARISNPAKRVDPKQSSVRVKVAVKAGSTRLDNLSLAVECHSPVELEVGFSHGRL